MIPVKLAPIATKEADPMPIISRRWNVDASGANCSAGDLPYWVPVPLPFLSPDGCVRYIRRGLDADVR